MDSSNLVNASIVWYVSFTFLFFVLKFKFFPNNNYYWILAFLTISCVLQTIQNITLTASPELCGAPDAKLALYSTVVPWVVVFTVFTLFLLSAPGWLRVFSNTFGVSAAEAYGLKEFVNELFKKPLNPGTDPKLIQMLDTIYSDKMSLVIELDIDDVTEEGDRLKFPAIDKLVELKIIEAIPPEGDANLRNLYSALLLKDTVGFFIWFLLIGIFCILVSTITLLSSSCSPKVGSSYDSIFNS
jgi:hypothetical protein